MAVANEHTEPARVGEVLAVLGEGGDVAVVTDAGTPGISDPGERLVRAVLDADFEVTTVPGPVAGRRRAGDERAAGRPLRVRGLPAPDRRRPSGPAGRAGGGAAHDRALRGAAPSAAHDRGPGRRARRRPTRRRDAGADQALRDGRAGRAGLGRRGRRRAPRRVRPRRGRSARRRRARPTTTSSGRRCATSSPPAPPAGTRPPPWPGGSACPGGRSTSSRSSRPGTVGPDDD